MRITSGEGEVNYLHWQLKAELMALRVCGKAMA